MIDLDRAREVVAAREQARIDTLVNEEAAQQEHRRMMAVTGAEMIAGQERNRQQREAAHRQARALARAAKDRVAELVEQREQIDATIGRLKADAEAARKTAAKCTAPDPNDFPTEDEIDRWKATRRQLDEAVFRLETKIAVQDRFFADAQQREWEAASVFERARQAEMDARV